MNSESMVRCVNLVNSCYSPSPPTHSQSYDSWLLTPLPQTLKPGSNISGTACIQFPLPEQESKKGLRPNGSAGCERVRAAGPELHCGGSRTESGRHERSWKWQIDGAPVERTPRCPQSAYGVAHLLRQVCGERQTEQHHSYAGGRSGRWAGGNGESVHPETHALSISLILKKLVTAEWHHHNFARTLSFKHKHFKA